MRLKWRKTTTRDVLKALPEIHIGIPSALILNDLVLSRLKCEASLDVGEKTRDVETKVNLHCMEAQL